jgi:hypothetical protein
MGFTVDGEVVVGINNVMGARKHLSSLKNHLDDMSITMPNRSLLGGTIKGKDIHAPTLSTNSLSVK